MVKIILKLIKLWHLLQTINALKIQFGDVKLSNCEEMINKGIDKTYKEVSKKTFTKNKFEAEQIDKIVKFIDSVIDIK